MNGAEIEANRAGTSQDTKAAVAVKFARALVEHKGEVTNTELQSIRDAGFSEADIVEVITHVGMNILTNILGKRLQRGRHRRGDHPCRYEYPDQYLGQSQPGRH
ncbi:hypothetical protein BN874_1300013 [Candidatus Contendobacter odensis Run_B_J11]|uniref:Carboxymuconolactone decarboxylase-like domain-containing protein n=1 Tax=Candidatus Contendobacter odensis Run_B_J11 TaxID=1400861 RepID=A0A7U7J2X5_9GAMM|nr:hypothetical protein BN874_1300013 [Candidatus Contendobacter odensis Run_B_J11]